MTKYREILRLLSLGISERKIAESCDVSRNTVSRIRKRSDAIGLKWPLEASLTDKVLETMLYPKGTVDTSEKRMPDFEYIRRELLKNGVTKKLLWTEYLEDCRRSGDNPLMYSQFCFHIQQNEQKRRATMHIPRKPGEQIEVDWAGDPAHIVDPDTGEITDAWIFVGVLTYSQYAYVEAFINERTQAWITAHIHMYEFFGGVSRILISDNCATAVDRKQSDWYTPKLNQTYHEMAEHYNTAVIPARVRRPRDKPVTEGSVGNISREALPEKRGQQKQHFSWGRKAITDAAACHPL